MCCHSWVLEKIDTFFVLLVVRPLADLCAFSPGLCTYIFSIFDCALQLIVIINLSPEYDQIVN